MLYYLKRCDGWPKKIKYPNRKLLTVTSFQINTAFFCFYFEYFFYRLGVFMPGVLTPIFARREGRGLLATDIITFS